jgi:hypothetical protein
MIEHLAFYLGTGILQSLKKKINENENSFFWPVNCHFRKRIHGNSCLWNCGNKIAKTLFNFLEILARTTKISN